MEQQKDFWNKYIEVIGSDTETLKEIKEKIIQKIIEETK